MVMDPHEKSASARNCGPSEGYTCQVPQCSAQFDTSTLPQQREIRIPVSPRKSPGRVRDPRCSPCILETPEEDILQSRPSSKNPPMNGLGEQEDHNSSSVATMSKATAANRIQSPIVSLGHRATARDTYLGDRLPDHSGREVADQHRLEAAATLVWLMCSTFFPNAKTLGEQISLLTALWTSIRQDDEYITTVHRSVEAKETPTQITKTRSKSESAAVLQLLDEERELEPNSKRLISGDDSAPRTPDSHGSKRKSSSLTPSFNANLPRRLHSEAITPELHRLHIGAPPAFSPNIFPEQSSSSPTESRRTRPRVRRITSEDSSRPAEFAKPSAAGRSLNLSIIDDDRAVSSVGLQNPPNYIHAIKEDESDDPFGPFTENNHGAMIPTEDALLLVGDLHAEMSHSGFRAEGTLAQDSKRSLSRNDRPNARKLSPYAKRPPRSLAMETIIREAIINPLTKFEMGIAWSKTSSGTWRQQKSHMGWIYIYQLPNEFNTVKIGITQVSIEARLDSWTEQCGHKTMVAYPSIESEREPVPNIYRLEAIVHAELAASRLEEMDCSCGKKHIEWFEEALAHARKVVVKWSEWMRTNPYKEVEPQHWHLSPQHIPVLAELSRPSPREPADGSATKPIRI